MNNDPEIFIMRTKDDEIKDLKYKTEKHDHEKILKSVKIDNEFYKKEYKSLNKKKVLLIITEILIGSGSAISTSINYVIIQSKHWYSINFFYCFINISYYFNHK